MKRENLDLPEDFNNRVDFKARAEAFQKELAALEEKHGIELDHEDGHGGFLYQDALRPIAILERCLHACGHLLERRRDGTQYEFDREGRLVELFKNGRWT